MSEPTPVPNEFFTGLTAALLFAGTSWFSVIAAIFSSPWWLALPVVVAALLWWITRPRRRDEQLAQVIGLDELPRTDEVDLVELEMEARWEEMTPAERLHEIQLGLEYVNFMERLKDAERLKDDTRWACDLERDTGLEEGERR